MNAHSQVHLVSINVTNTRIGINCCKLENYFKAIAENIRSHAARLHGDMGFWVPMSTGNTPAVAHRRWKEGVHEIQQVFDLRFEKKILFRVFNIALKAGRLAKVFFRILI